MRLRGRVLQRRSSFVRPHRFYAILDKYLHRHPASHRSIYGRQSIRRGQPLASAGSSRCLGLQGPYARSNEVHWSPLGGNARHARSPTWAGADKVRCRTTGGSSRCGCARPHSSIGDLPPSPCAARTDVGFHRQTSLLVLRTFPETTTSRSFPIGLCHLLLSLHHEAALTDITHAVRKQIAAVHLHPIR